MNKSKKPLWKKSMLDNLNYYNIVELLDEIAENGDPYGYNRIGTDENENGYYQEYKEQFDELSDGAYSLADEMRNWGVSKHWDDMTVALLGETQKVLGYDSIERDYYQMLSYEEDWAQEEARKRIERLNKSEIIRLFKNILSVLVCFFDVKASHDCLVSIVEELDERAAIFKDKNNEINRLYEDLTGKNTKTFEDIIEQLPPRMWVE